MAYGKKRRGGKRRFSKKGKKRRGKRLNSTYKMNRGGGRL